MPTSGGLYYAAAVLAPPGYGPFAAWITGWSNWLVQVTGAPSVDYALASMILAAASITYPSYVPENYHIWLLTTLIMIIHGCISSMPTRWIATFNSYGSSFNIVALIIVIILIPANTKRPSLDLPRFSKSSEVWGTFYEGTDFPNGIAILMSFISVIWTMSGYDAPFHLAEVALPLHTCTSTNRKYRNAQTPPSPAPAPSSSPPASAASSAGSSSSSQPTPSFPSTTFSNPTSVNRGRPTCCRSCRKIRRLRFSL
jgi:Amino acid permease